MGRMHLVFAHGKQHMRDGLAFGIACALRADTDAPLASSALSMISLPTHRQDRKFRIERQCRRGRIDIDLLDLLKLTARISVDLPHMIDMRLLFFQRQPQRFGKYDLAGRVARAAAQAIFLLTGTDQRQ